MQEVLLALWLEHEHTKDQILEMYLNRVYFGSGAYGVEAASRRYFGKSARDVTLSEAALLAGLLKAPSRLSPARDPEGRRGARRSWCWPPCATRSMIGDKELTMAMSAPATRAASYWTGSENYVADRIMEELPGLIGDVRTDIVVDTTVDLTLQKLAEKSIRRLVDENGKKLNVSQGALVSIDNSGAVRAMVGGYDYADSQFDRASEARRQPGSAFKPFVYLAALEQGRTPDSIRNDAPIKIGKWTPDNYDGKYYGQVTLADGAGQVAELGRRAAGHGSRPGRRGRGGAPHGHPVRPAGQHLDRARHVGSDAARTDRRLCALRQWRLPAGHPFHQPRHRRPTARCSTRTPAAATPRVVSAEVVGMMNAMMTGTVETGTARKAAFAWPAAGKTGTSQNSRDAWFVGYTANLTTGVWFGNDDGAPMKKVTGGALPAQAWHEFMVAAHEGVPVAAAARHLAIPQSADERPLGRSRRSAGWPSVPSQRAPRRAGSGRQCDAELRSRPRTIADSLDRPSGAARRCRRPGPQAQHARSSTS